MHRSTTRKNPLNRRAAYLLVLSFAVVAEAGAQQYVYPANGQSPEQQQNDEAACYSWAVQQTGVDPANPPTQQAAPRPATTASGSTPGAGVVGAARGAIIGSAVGGDAGTGAAIGAVSARSRSRRQNANAANHEQQQQQAYTQQQQASFGKARAACLEGRGYTVK